jgi:hypothetical protein
MHVCSTNLDRSSPGLTGGKETPGYTPKYRAKEPNKFDKRAFSTDWDETGGAARIFGAQSVALYGIVAVCTSLMALAVSS